MVLLHVDDDVLDLGQEIHTLGPAWVGAVARLADRARMERVERMAGEPAPRPAARERQSGGRTEPEQELSTFDLPSHARTLRPVRRFVLGPPRSVV